MQAYKSIQHCECIPLSIVAQDVVYFLKVVRQVSRERPSNLQVYSVFASSLQECQLSKRMTQLFNVMFYFFQAERHPQSRRKWIHMMVYQLQESVGQAGLPLHAVCLGRIEPRNERSPVQKNTHILVKLSKCLWGNAWIWAILTNCRIRLIESYWILSQV